MQVKPDWEAHYNRAAAFEKDFHTEYHGPGFYLWPGQTVLLVPAAGESFVVEQMADERLIAYVYGPWAITIWVHCGGPVPVRMDRRG